MIRWRSWHDLFVILLCVMESEVLLPQHSQCCVSGEGLKFITMACHLSYVNVSFVVQFRKPK